MSAPLLLFAWSVIAGLAFLFVPPVRRRARGFAAAASAVAAVGVLAMPVESPLEILGVPLKVPAAWVILGRAMVLDPTNRLAIALLYFGGAVLFAAAGPSFVGRGRVVAGWTMLASLAGALLIRPFLFAAVFFELAALAGAVLLSSSDSESQEPSMRLLMVMTPAMLCVLLAGWFVDTAGVTSATPELARSATGLLLFGFAILLAVPPFHLWLPPAAAARRGDGAAFVLLALQTTGLMLALRFLDTYDWLRQSADLYRSIRLAGLITAGVGAAAALAETDGAKSTAYSLLSDIGPVLVGLGLPGGSGVSLAIALGALRIASFGMATLGSRPDRDAANPWQAAAAIYGRLSLAGFPLTPSFPVRALLLGTLFAVDATAFWILGMASVALTWTALRGSRLRALSETDVAGVARPGRIVAALVVCLALSVIPGPLIGALAAGSTAWVNLSP